MKKAVSLCLILLSVGFFLTYISWAESHSDLRGWGAGIWLVAVGTFITGVCTFFDNSKRNNND